MGDLGKVSSAHNVAGEFFGHRRCESGKGFSSTKARFGGRVRLPASWRFLAKARLQPPVEIGDEIMKSDRTNGLAITSNIGGYELFL